MTSTVPFVRSRFTWLAYFMLGYYAYLQSNPGPIMPFLRQELGLSYTIASLHFSAFALGMMIAGVFGDAMAERIGRYRMFWGGAIGMAFGGLAFALGGHAVLTIFGAFIMGTIGSFTLVIIQAALADEHGPNRAIALTEVNAMAGVGMVGAPLMVSLMQRSGIGWQATPVVALFILAALVLVYRHVELPQRQQLTQPYTDVLVADGLDPLPAMAGVTTTPPQQTLPSAFGRILVIIFLVVCVEWSLISWGADFLETEVGLSKVDAASAMSLFFGAFLLGRLVGSRLARRFTPMILLVMALTCVAIGFIPFWLGPVTLVHLVGLAMAGFGASNLFPMALSVASNTVPAHLSDLASGRIAIVAGSAVLTAPQVLGTLADQIGLMSAYGGVIILVVAIYSLIWLNSRIA